MGGAIQIRCHVNPPKLVEKANRQLTQTGFTLVELVITVVLIGILAVGAIRFITTSVEGYVDTAERQQLATAGLIAAEKVSRELRQALPNSIRPRDGESFPDSCVEYIPVEDGTDYIEIPLDADSNQITALSPGITITTDMRLVVYPMSVTSLYADPIVSPGPVSPVFASLASGANDSVTLTLSANHRFSTDSPTRRLYVVSNKRAYCFDGDKLYYYEGYSSYESDGRPASSSRIVLLDQLDISGTTSTFDYQPASLVRNAVINFRFTLDNGRDSWMTEQEVQIRNVP